MQPIPLSLVRSGRELTEPRLSPDGTSVAFVQRTGPAASINVVALVGDVVERQRSFGPEPAPGRGLGGGCFTWAAHRDADAILYCAVDGELWAQRGIRVDPVTSHGRSVRAPVVPPTAEPAFVVYAVDEAEIWMTDLTSLESERLDDGRHAFCFDPAVSPDGGTVSWQAWSPPDMPWDGSVRVDHDVATGECSQWGPADGAVQQPRFSPRGTAVHVHDGGGWLNVYIGDTPAVAEDVEHAGPTWGMGNRSYALDDTGERLAFVRNEAGHGALNVVDLSTGVIERLGRGVHGSLSWVGDHLVAIRSGSKTPTQIVAYDVAGARRRTLAHSQPDVWNRDELPEPEMVEASSGDGATTLHARRFVAGVGRMLVWVHGGPTDQWQCDWRPRVVYWWSRGWDVLVVDPRGTTGHGRSYQQALRGGWGRLDVDDTAALIRHAHAARWASAETTVVIGGSSGGLTVLGVLADHPSLASGGVASYPVSDLRALTEVTHRFEAHYTDTLVAPNDGSADSDAAFGRLSPLHRAASIRSPLLVFHGTDDPVVPIAQSESLVEAIQDAGGDVDLVVYEGEGHGFRRPENVADEYERTASFLARVAMVD